MKIQHWVLGTAAVAIALTVGRSVIGQVVTPVPAALTLATSPLFLKNPVKPAFIMAVDDSGSMDGEGSYITNDGALWWHTGNRSFAGLDRNDNAAAGVLNFNRVGAADGTWKKYVYLFPFGSGNADSDLRVYTDAANDHFAVPPTTDFAFSRAPEYNAAYFDPAVVYDPWTRADGTSFPSLDTDAEFTAAPADPARGSTRLNLTQNFAYTDANQTFRMYEGMRIPAGARYRIRARNPNNACSGPGTGFANLDTWADSPTGGLTIRNSDNGNNQEYCDIAFSYFPATFYLKATTALPAGYGYTATPTTATSYDGVALKGYEIKPANFAAGKYVPAMTSFANWFTYYRKRHLATRAGITQAFTGRQRLRVGYFKINDRIDVEMQDIDVATERAALYSRVIAHNGSGGTPNREAVVHLGNQFKRTSNNPPIQKACQRNYGMLFTDGFSNASNPESPGNIDGGTSPYFQTDVFRDTTSNTLADIVANLYSTNLRTDLPVGKVPVASSCNINDPKQDCNKNLHMTFFGITLGARGLEYGINAAATANPYTTKPVWPTAFQDRHPSAVDDIWHGAINSRGLFLNARTPREISDALKNVLDVAQAPSRPSGGQSVTGSRLNAGSFNVTPSFSRDDSDWSSTLTAHRINPTDGSNGAQLWEASSKLDSLGHAARNIWTATANVSSTNRTVVAFAPAVGLTAAKLGVNALTLSSYGANEQQLFDYIRGDTSLEGAGLRKRTTRLGDIINSAPQIAAAKDDYGWATASGLSASARSSYTTYLTTNGPTGKKDRPSYVFVGANDGMLHAFEGDRPCTVSGSPAMCTPSTAGNETFAYIPNGVLGNVGLLANPNYDHRYYVDGNIAVGDVYNGTAWKSVLVGASGAGGRGVFGLDISNPAGFNASSVLWEVNATTDGDIGHVMGEPVIAPINFGDGVVKWVAIFGNGYNSNRSEPVLYMVDAITGAVLVKLVASDNDSVNANGLGNVAATDTDGDGLVDTVYGGDLRGNLWKFALSGSAWGVGLGGVPLFTAVDSNGARQPITGGLEVSAGPGEGVSIFFGTGRYFVDGDNSPGTSPQVQSLYSIWDNGTAVTGTRGTVLQAQTISAEVTGATPSRTTSKNAVNYATKRGWYMDLKVGTTASAAKGERFLGTPRLQNGKVFFTTFVPLQDECDPDGTNWLYGLDALTGAAAMMDVSLSASQNPKVCTGDCGAITLSNGGPVRDTSVLLPPPTPLPGLVGGCVPGSPGCVTPTTPTFQRCTLVIRAAGAPPLYLPRPCGRQSWRQIR